jgi:hypothetical protein
MKILDNWDDLDWFLIQNSVSRLQVKIYQAALINDLDRSHKIQKVLLRSSVAKYLAIKLLTENTFVKSNPFRKKNVTFTGLEKKALFKSLQFSYNKNPILPTNFSNLMTLEDSLKEILVYFALSPQWEAYYFQSQIKIVSSSFEATHFLKRYLNSTPKWAIFLSFKHFIHLNPEKLIRECKTFPLIQNFIRQLFKKSSSTCFKDVTLVKVLLLKIILYKLPKLIIKCINSLANDKGSNLTFIYLFAYPEILVLHPKRDSLYLIKTKLGSFLYQLGFDFSLETINILHTLPSSKKKAVG